ncbi:hypothetical protein KG088_04370 [Halomonas sp. TRM85114]|uniref:hypothetical protein n=1 Tax=Halomonas jincaotanensis TaxID=2810616 RepID=UPI001BD4DF2D|nr:hypothetical protein [Halomonas jincaotanensis]MBS9402855.1 hypothetical protein [Halomonas jincaotanensis]
MSQHDEKRRKLLGSLNRKLAYSAPLLALVAGGAILQATASDSSTQIEMAPVLETSLLLASNHAEAEAQGEAEAEAEGEAQAEGEADGEGEAEGEAEAEGGPNAAVARPDDYSPGYSESGDNPEEMLGRGKALYSDTTLSTNGLSCATCHGSEGRDTGYNATFQQPFPHQVAMADNQFGMPEVHVDEMIQVCMVAPMSAEPLEWGSEELTSLAAYMVEVQKRFAGEPHDL